MNRFFAPIRDFFAEERLKSDIQRLEDALTRAFDGVEQSALLRMARGDLISSERTAKFEQMLIVDSANGQVTVRLPKPIKRDAGRYIPLLHKRGGNGVLVLAPSETLIDGSAVDGFTGTDALRVYWTDGENYYSQGASGACEVRDDAGAVDVNASAGDNAMTWDLVSRPHPLVQHNPTGSNAAEFRLRKAGFWRIDVNIIAQRDSAFDYSGWALLAINGTNEQQRAHAFSVNGIDARLGWFWSRATRFTEGDVVHVDIVRITGTGGVDTIADRSYMQFEWVSP